MRSGLVILAYLLTACMTARAQESPSHRTSLEVPAPRQFDFWVGQWDVNNRFLQEDGTWQSHGSAVDAVYAVLDGKAILEFWDGTARQGPLRGFSLRYYDPHEERWVLVLNWPQQDRPFFFELKGAFRHGRGEFFRSRVDTSGTEVLTRYTFSDITPESLRWDGAFSTDGGVTWRTTWIMEFVQTAEEAPWPAPDASFPTYDEGELCTSERSARFDVLEGRWEGTYERRQEEGWAEMPARMQAHRVLDGCAVFNLTHYGAQEEYALFQLRSYLPERRAWVTVSLDDQPGTPHRYLSGRFDEDGTAALTEVVADSTRDDRLRGVVWRTLQQDSLRYELTESSDGGQSWVTVGRVHLGREE